MQIATVIFQQIVSLDNLAFFSWGGHNLIKSESTLQFSCSGRNIPSHGAIKITLTPNDTYNIELFRTSPFEKLAEANDVYWDNLVEIIDAMLDSKDKQFWFSQYLAA